MLVLQAPGDYWILILLDFDFADAMQLQSNLLILPLVNSLLTMPKRTSDFLPSVLPH